MHYIACSRPRLKLLKVKPWCLIGEQERGTFSKEVACCSALVLHMKVVFSELFFIETWRYYSSRIIPSLLLNGIEWVKIECILCRWVKASSVLGLLHWWESLVFYNFSDLTTCFFTNKSCKKVILGVRFASVLKLHLKLRILRAICNNVR